MYWAIPFCLKTCNVFVLQNKDFILVGRSEHSEYNLNFSLVQAV